MPEVRDIIAEIEEAGWIFYKQEGSHRQYRHPDKPGKVTVNGKPGDDLSAGRYYDILRQAGLRGKN